MRKKANKLSVHCIKLLQNLAKNKQIHKHLTHLSGVSAGLPWPPAPFDFFYYTTWVFSVISVAFPGSVLTGWLTDWRTVWLSEWLLWPYNVINAVFHLKKHMYTNIVLLFVACFCWMSTFISIAGLTFYLDVVAALCCNPLLHPYPPSRPTWHEYHQQLLYNKHIVFFMMMMWRNTMMLLLNMIMILVFKQQVKALLL